MSYSFLAAQQRQAAAQRAYDNAEPLCQPDSFLETEEGQKWLRETAEHVAEGGEFRCSGVLITFECVIDELEMTDSEAWILFTRAAAEYALSPTDARYQTRELAKMDIRKAAVDVAIELIAPHADQWALEQRELEEAICYGL